MHMELLNLPSEPHQHSRNLHSSKTHIRHEPSHFRGTHAADPLCCQVYYNRQGRAYISALSWLEVLFHETQNPSLVKQEAEMPKPFQSS